jgi:hypothetical protein
MSEIGMLGLLRWATTYRLERFKRETAWCITPESHISEMRGFLEIGSDGPSSFGRLRS